MISPVALSSLLSKIDNKTLNFKGVLEFIDANYDYTPTQFTNGLLHNAPYENEAVARYLVLPNTII